jgi:hypothetical protein
MSIQRRASLRGTADPGIRTAIIMNARKPHQRQ